MIVHLNGRWLEADQATIRADDRGLLYADGVFETVRLCEGGYFRFDAHYRRLALGAATLRLALPEERALYDLARELVRRNELRDGMLRITLTRGPESGSAPTLLLGLSALPADWRARAERGWALITAGIRHPAPDAMPSHVKSLGRLHGLLARIEAREAGADDALLLTSAGVVCEGPTWNVFWRVGDRLFTPSLDTGVLDGVTRSAVLELAEDAGIAVSEGSWPRGVLDDAEEVFATMSSQGCVAVRSLDGRPLDPGRREAVRVLSERYWRLVAEEADRGQGE